MSWSRETGGHAAGALSRQLLVAWFKVKKCCTTTNLLHHHHHHTPPAPDVDLSCPDCTCKAHLCFFMH